MKLVIIIFLLSLSLFIFSLFSGGDCLDLLRAAAALNGSRDIRTLGDNGLINDLTTFLILAAEFDRERNQSKNKQLVDEAHQILDVLENTLKKEWNSSLPKVTQRDIIRAMKEDNGAQKPTKKLAPSIKTMDKKARNQKKSDAQKDDESVDAAKYLNTDDEDEEMPMFFHKLSPLLKNNKYFCTDCTKYYENFKSFKRHQKDMHEKEIETEEIKCHCLLPRKGAPSEICYAELSKSDLNNHVKEVHKEEAPPGKSVRGFLTRGKGFPWKTCWMNKKDADPDYPDLPLDPSTINIKIRNTNKGHIRNLGKVFNDMSASASASKDSKSSDDESSKASEEKEQEPTKRSRKRKAPDSRGSRRIDSSSSDESDEVTEVEAEPTKRSRKRTDQNSRPSNKDSSSSESDEAAEGVEAEPTKRSRRQRVQGLRNKDVESADISEPVNDLESSSVLQGTMDVIDEICSNYDPDSGSGIVHEDESQDESEDSDSNDQDSKDFSKMRIRNKKARHARRNIEEVVEILPHEKEENQIIIEQFKVYQRNVPSITVNKDTSTLDKCLNLLFEAPDSMLNYMIKEDSSFYLGLHLNFKSDKEDFCQVKNPTNWLQSIAGEDGLGRPARR